MEHEYSEIEGVLLRRALTPANSSGQLLLKAQAISDLFERGTPVPTDRIRAELEAVLSTRFGTARESSAQGMPARLLALMDGEPTEPETEDDRLAQLCHEGWEALRMGDVATADAKHAEYAVQAPFPPWDHIVERHAERQRREDDK